MEQNRVKAAMEKAADYIDRLTIHSEVNVPGKVVPSPDIFFTWDTERRSPNTHKLLYSYSYFTGVIMEGLYDIYEFDPEHGGVYYEYVKDYLDSMIRQEEDGSWVLDFERAGYVDCHGADCYKTAALYERFSKGGDVYGEITALLYKHLTDETYVNSAGHTPCLENMPEELGHNYCHGWANTPRFRFWLDGIYMLQPFLAHHAARIGDKKQLSLVQERFNWVAKTLLAPNGLYYHGGNSREDVCNFFWTRSMGWYGMAMVDVMEVLPEEYLEERKAALKLFVDGILKYQKENGMWTNLADQPATETNRLETSGTAMMSYIILKGIRKGWLDETYREAAVRAFVGITEEKLDEDGLKDIYMRADASGKNNYELEKFYRTDEGKGSGPYIMAYSEMRYLTSLRSPSGK